MVSLKSVSIALGILAGTAGLTNSGYNLYRNFVVTPSQNAEYNRTLIDQEPLIVEMVEIHPDPKMSMSVEVTVKVFKTGDILVESGTRREIIPFRLHKRTAMLDSVFPIAWAADTMTIDGVEYEIDTIRFIESTAIEDKNIQKRVRKFADGTMETSIIDIRSNTVLKTNTQKMNLTDKELQAIEKSPYKKRIYIPKR